MLVSLSKRNNSHQTEIFRIGIFLLIIIFYFTTKVGFCIGVLHLILVLFNQKKFGMSRIVKRLLLQLDK